jgi:hypothetical protein
MFVTRRLCGSKPQVKEAQGPADRPNPMAGRPDFESVQAETWRLLSHVGSEDDPMPDSRWKPEGVASRPPPNQLN